MTENRYPIYVRPFNSTWRCIGDVTADGLMRYTADPADSELHSTSWFQMPDELQTHTLQVSSVVGDVHEHDENCRQGLEELG